MLRCAPSCCSVDERPRKCWACMIAHAEALLILTHAHRYAFSVCKCVCMCVRVRARVQLSSTQIARACDPRPEVLPACAHHVRRCARWRSSRQCGPSRSRNPHLPRSTPAMSGHASTTSCASPSAPRRCAATQVLPAHMHQHRRYIHTCTACPAAQHHTSCRNTKNTTPALHAPHFSTNHAEAALLCITRTASIASADSITCAAPPLSNTCPAATPDTTSPAPPAL